jgi:hypothetical protein
MSGESTFVEAPGTSAEYGAAAGAGLAREFCR